MKLLLQKNVENLGKLGEIVTVANGYGRNFLLPVTVGDRDSDDGSSYSSPADSRPLQDGAPAGPGPTGVEVDESDVPF